MENFNEEIWKNIPDCEGYQASNFGNIRSLDRVVFNKGTNKTYTIRGRELKTVKDKKGYVRVTISINGKLCTKTVHRMVWSAFYGTIPPDKEINHIDENPSNNSLLNLCLVSHKENINWGNWRTKQKVAHINRKDQSKQVLQFDLDGNLINKYKSVSDAARINNYKMKAIQSVCCGYKYRKTAYGYIWKYKI